MNSKHVEEILWGCFGRMFGAPAGRKDGHKNYCIEQLLKLPKRPDLSLSQAALLLGISINSARLELVPAPVEVKKEEGKEKKKRAPIRIRDSRFTRYIDDLKKAATGRDAKDFPSTYYWDLSRIVEAMYGRVVAAPHSERRAVVAEAVTDVVSCLSQRERLLQEDEVKMQWGFDPKKEGVPFVTVTERNFKRWPLSWVEAAHRIRQAGGNNA